jgi:hypothetical protein
MKIAPPSPDPIKTYESLASSAIWHRIDVMYDHASVLTSRSILAIVVPSSVNASRTNPRGDKAAANGDNNPPPSRSMIPPPRWREVRQRRDPAVVLPSQFRRLVVIRLRTGSSSRATAATDVEFATLPQLSLSARRIRTTHCRRCRRQWRQSGIAIFACSPKTSDHPNLCQRRRRRRRADPPRRPIGASPPRPTILPRID